MPLKKSQKSLKNWTKQKWRTKSGKPSTQGPKATASVTSRRRLLNPCRLKSMQPPQEQSEKGKEGWQAVRQAAQENSEEDEEVSLVSMCYRRIRKAHRHHRKRPPPKRGV